MKRNIVALLRIRSVRLYALLVVLLAAWTFLAWPTLRWLWGEWWGGNDYYSHGVLVAPLALWLAWRHWPADDGRGGRLWTLLLMAAAMALHLFWVHEHAYYLSVLALLVLLGAMALFLRGWRALRHADLPLLLLLLADPFPFVAGSSVPLSLFTGRLATAFVRVLGVPAIIHGAEVSLPNVSLVVGAQCSGVNSLVALTTLALLVAYLWCRGWWRRLLILLSAIPLAVAGNVARVSSLLAVANIWGADAGFKFYHEYSGFVFFLTALSILFLLLRALRCKTLNDEYL